MSDEVDIEESGYVVLTGTTEGPGEITVEIGDAVDGEYISVNDIQEHCGPVLDGSWNSTQVSWSNEKITADKAIINGCDVEKEILSVRAENLELRNRIGELEQQIASICKRMK